MPTLLDDTFGREPTWDVGPGLVESTWRRRWLVLAVALLMGLAGYALAVRQPVLYQASARLILSDPRDSGVFGETASRGFVNPDRHLRNEAAFMESMTVAARAAEKVPELGLAPEHIQGRIRAEPSSTLDLIVISALHPTPEGAADVANAVSEAYREVVTEEVVSNAERAIAELAETKQELEAEVDRLDAALEVDPDDQALLAQREAAIAQLSELNARSNQIAVDAALFGAGVAFFEPARVPVSPAQPKPLRSGVMGAMAGFVLAGGFAFWLAQRKKQVVESRHDPAPILGAPLLGQIAEFRSAGVSSPIPTLALPGSAIAEMYQFVVSSIEFALAETGGSIIAVTSPRVGDGKTLTSINVAIAAAREGRKVLLVDADVRAGGLSRFGGTDPEPGLTDLVRGDRSFDECVRYWDLSDSLTMPVVPTGSPLANPSSLFRGGEFRKAMDALSEQAEMVIVDTPPLLAVADTSAIAARADGVVLVIPHGAQLALVDEVRRQLEFVATPLLGYVFNRADLQATRSVLGGKYQHGYGYGTVPTQPTGRWSWLSRLRSRG